MALDESGPRNFQRYIGLTNSSASGAAVHRASFFNIADVKLRQMLYYKAPLGNGGVLFYEHVEHAHSAFARLLRVPSEECGGLHTANESLKQASSSLSVMKRFKKFVRGSLHSLGHELHRLTPASNATLQIVRSLDNFGVDIVVDVGANEGQFASELRSVGFQGDILSIEPLEAAHAKLQEAAKNDRRWRVYKRAAVGDTDGETTINIAGNSVSSSVLPMLRSHETAAPESRYVGTELAPVVRIDTIAADVLGRYRRPFLKVDVQGYEWQVLDGASATLPKLTGLLCELSLVPLYDRQRLWREMIDRLEGCGFSLWSLRRGFSDPSNGQTLQVDAIFFRE